MAVCGEHVSILSLKDKGSQADIENVIWKREQKKKSMDFFMLLLIPKIIQKRKWAFYAKSDSKS